MVIRDDLVTVIDEYFATLLSVYRAASNRGKRNVSRPWGRLSVNVPVCHNAIKLGARRSAGPPTKASCRSDNGGPLPLVA